MSRPIDLIISVFNSVYTTWIALALPAIAFVREILLPERYYPELMWETGVLASQMVVVALLISPLRIIFQGSKPITMALFWLQKRRRAIGVAAFSYAALHTIFYLRYTNSIELVFLEMVDWDLAIGWAAMFGLTGLAVTSNAWSVKVLGTRWKPFQRTAYGAAFLVGLHWFLIGNFLQDLWYWAIPVVALQIIRMAWPFKSRSSPIY